MRWGTLILRLAMLFLLVLTASPADAQHIVTVTVPSGVSFSVVDVSASTTGSPTPMRISFSNAIGFKGSNKLKISVQADSSTFAGPGTTRIAVSKVSWTATASPGSASNGTLTSTSYTQVYQSPARPTSGSVDLNWTLASIAAAGLRAGTHTLTVRWKFEAF